MASLVLGSRKHSPSHQPSQYLAEVFGWGNLKIILALQPLRQGSRVLGMYDNLIEIKEASLLV